MIELRHINLDEDYAIIEQWWKRHGVAPTPQAILPPCGVIALEDDVMLSAAWAYMSNGIGVCFIMFPVTNPDVSPIKRGKAMRHTLSGLQQICKKNNYGFAMLAAESSVLTKVDGWNKSYDNINVFWREI